MQKKIAKTEISPKILTAHFWQKYHIFLKLIPYLIQIILSKDVEYFANAMQCFSRFTKMAHI